MLGLGQCSTGPKKGQGRTGTSQGQGYGRTGGRVRAMVGPETGPEQVLDMDGVGQGRARVVQCPVRVGSGQDRAWAEQ